MAHEPDHMTAYNHLFHVQLQTNNYTDLRYPYEHTTQYNNHIDQAIPVDEGGSPQFYEQFPQAAISKQSRELYVHERLEQLEQCPVPRPTPPMISFPHELGDFDEGLLRLTTTVQYFLQSGMSVSNISALGQDRLAMHIEHIAHTAGMTFPAYLINHTARYLHTLCIDTTGFAIPYASAPFTPKSSFSNGTSESPSLGTPSLPVSQREIRNVEQEFENFPFSPQIPSHIQGRFMPQKVYSSRAKADHDRYVKDVDLKHPIVFSPKYHDGLGILLSDALDTKIEDILAGADEVVLNHGPPSAYIRLRVPGYAPDGKQKHQISLRTHEKSRKPLKKARLLRSAAKAIKKILQNLANEQQNDQQVANLPFKWTVGKGAGQIGIHNLYIASLNNVSRGTWQPHLYLDPDYSMLH